MESSSTECSAVGSDRDATLRKIALNRARRGDFTYARVFAEKIESEELRIEVQEEINSAEDAIAAHG